MLLALDTLVQSGAPAVSDAGRHAERVRFSLARVAELKRAAQADGGAFAPARVEVALCILENHVALAAGYVARTMQRARRGPGRRSVRATVDEAVSYIEEQREAA
jgi:hypothetical protein